MNNTKYIEKQQESEITIYREQNKLHKSKTINEWEQICPWFELEHSQIRLVSC
jgi:hypothetical protein